VNAEPAAEVPKKLAATISRASPATRETAVPTAKIAVLMASRRRGRSAVGIPDGGSETIV
jgi:hypothetical protein